MLLTFVQVSSILKFLETDGNHFCLVGAKMLARVEGDEPPVKSAPGRFPYKEGGDYYKIALEDLGVSACEPLYIAAHAEVYTDCREETAWADEGAIPFGKGWAMYFVYSGCPCDS